MILDKLDNKTAEPIRKLNPFAQREAIEKCMSKCAFKPVNSSLNDRWKLLELVKELQEIIIKNPKDSPLEKAALIFLYRNGVLHPRAPLGDEGIDGANEDFEIFTAYLEGRKKGDFVGTALDSILLWAIQRNKTNCIKSLMEAGALPGLDSATVSICKIACAKDQEERKKLEETLVPILNKYKSKHKVTNIIQQAQKFADELVAMQRDSTEVWAMVDYFLKRGEIHPQLKLDYPNKFNF